MSLDKYVVGFIFGAAVGAAIAHPAKEAPRAVEERIQSEEKYIPQVVPFQEGTPPGRMQLKEVMPVQVVYKPADKNYLPD
ncbi:hypothetical protein HY497_00710 [Candidatus Woesearchaeota archaeon]|nr:hypothetical protein [Candidatus Woesearchaeota archaeon]